MRSGFFANWSRGLLILLVTLTATAACVTVLVLRSMEHTQADLGLSFSRCVMNTPNGLRLAGFTPVSRCFFSRAERISLGAGRLVIQGRSAYEADDVSLVLVGRQTSSVLILSGLDLAVGEFFLAPGTMEFQSVGRGKLRLSIMASSPDDASTGHLSLGDSCSIQATGYALHIAGAAPPAFTETEFAARFYPLGGAGKFVSGADECGCQLDLVDHDLSFAEPTHLGGIAFLSADDRCGDVHGGFIRIGRDREQTSIPHDSCVRLSASELLMRSLSMPKGSAELSTVLNGSFRSLELNDIVLIGRSVWSSVMAGIGIFLVFGGVVLLAKRLLATAGR